MAAAGAVLRCIPVADGPTRVQYLAWSSFNPSPATRAFLDAVPAPSRRADSG
ncbi:hypothetical protein [Nocardiopsis coralliicola]